jgi:hypothetical protein
MAMGHQPPRRKPPNTYPYKGQMLPLSDIARCTGINVRTLQYRLAKGMSPAKAFARIPSKHSTPQPASRRYDFHRPLHADREVEKRKSTSRHFHEGQTGFIDRGAGDYFEAPWKREK